MKITMLGSGSWKSSLSHRIMALGRELARSGWAVSVIVPAADKYNDFTPERNPRHPDLSIIQPYQPATASPLFNLLPYTVTAFVAMLQSRPDLIYLYKPTPITILGLLPRLLLRTPVVLDLDDLGSEVMKAQGQSAIQSKLVALCERLAIRFSSAVVVTSQYLKEHVQLQHPNKPILVLPNGVDLDAYPTRSATVPRPFIYYFGAINRLSLIEELLRAMPLVLKAHPDARLQVLGGGSALESAKFLAAQLGVAEAISFSGWISMDEAQDYTQFGDIAVCYQPDTPTVRAASNMKVFQYMAMSTVPVVSRVGDLPQYVQNGAAGTVVIPENPEALAGAIGDLLGDDDTRTRLAQAARELAESRYAWSVLARKLEVFLNETRRNHGWHFRRQLS